ncbi:hypothetical protein [Sphingosinicella sp. BN140058]|uniref:hypothetical protein n=1 Tax=Sphingosinicella sp. BN140058 TaxID=1892855 RepID=UPI00101280E5|nr:hypothetical protein [Sphingosinicella sp. BN140058]QAY76322.1 hypothetical protein ETR14_07095 [Sphingosinicella sp. BN140058]
MTRTSGGRGHSVFAIPIVLALLSLAGLVVGLIGDGLYDLVSWIALAAPIIAIGWALVLRRR